MLTVLCVIPFKLWRGNRVGHVRNIIGICEPVWLKKGSCVYENVYALTNVPSNYIFCSSCVRNWTVYGLCCSLVSILLLNMRFIAKGISLSLSFFFPIYVQHSHLTYYCWLWFVFLQDWFDKFYFYNIEVHTQVYLWLYTYKWLKQYRDIFLLLYIPMKPAPLWI